VPDTLTLIEEAEVIVASDESGLGAYAGPLVVGCVVAPKGWTPNASLTDSKKMTPAERARAAKALIADSRIAWQTLWATSTEVDAENVYYANVRLHTTAIAAALEKAASMFPGKKVLAVVDGNMKIPGAVSLPHADLRVLVCSAASVLAKVAHDTWMIEKMDAEYPGYGFANHVGYHSDEHDEALDRLGPCAIHRRSFAPIARLLKPKGPDVLDLMEELDKD
jgi:ribonuclease HII